MVFSSLIFIFRFLPIFLLIYYMTPARYRNMTLFLGSVCFYAFGEPVYVILILLSILVNYICGRKIGQKRAYIEINRQSRAGKGWLSIALVYDFGLLLFFKYSFFLEENLNRVIRVVSRISGEELLTVPEIKILLPLGISFYTFQIVSYVVDVYRGKVEAEESIINLGTYLCMFPQLIAGPIVTYNSVKDQLQYRRYSLRNFERGLRIFVMGLAAKVLIANRVGGLWRDIQTIGFESISTPLAWLGAFAYTLQIYFDFHGYSLMAIGLGKMIGFELPKNFDEPYLSHSITEFWQRWHMTLAQWFRDYVYIPLGGNREGRWKTVRNMFIVWAFTGLWHGAEWNFILWGMLTFLIMCLEKAGLKKWLDRTRIGSRIYMILLIPITWICFAITSISDLAVYFSRMFPFFGVSAEACIIGNDYITYLEQYGFFFLLGIFFCSTLPKKWYRMNQKRIVSVIVLAILFWVSIYYLASASNNPFLYFRF
ncbi:MAG: MBOAT family protein [Lachnospiraceae bacterium]|nr:MBOAT family protein [Lachnospiraceae bacterium]